MLKLNADALSHFLTSWDTPPLPPTPPSQRRSSTSLNILHINIISLKNNSHKHIEIKQMLHQHTMHIYLIQETKLNANHITPILPHYSIVQRDRQQGNGGDLLTLIHKDISYHNQSTNISILNDYTTETASISLKSGQTSINIINICTPPITSCPNAYQPDYSTLLILPSHLVCGDYNSHNQSWLTTHTNGPRGTTLNSSRI